MKDELKILAEQINYKELAMAKFKLSYDDDKTEIYLKKGLKRLGIKYDSGSDTYTTTALEFNNRFDIVSTNITKDVYAEDLRTAIQDFFTGFEYVMDRIR